MLISGAGGPSSRQDTDASVPVASALGLILREKLTGEAIPQRAAPGVELVREWIEDKAGADFEALALSLDDQKAFQGLALDLLRHLDLTLPDDFDQPSDDGDDGEEPEGEDQDESEDDNEGAGQPQSTEMAGEMSEGDDEGDSDTETTSEQDTAEGEPGDEGEEGMMPVRPNRPWTDIPEGFDYKASVPRPPGAELQRPKGSLPGQIRHKGSFNRYRGRR